MCCVTSSSCHEGVVLVLAFIPCQSGSKGWRFPCYGVEETIVSSAECSHLEDGGGSASTAATDDDVIRIATELNELSFDNNEEEVT